MSQGIGRLHGASIPAPEEGFGANESPDPPGVQTTRSGAVSSARFGRVWAALRVAVGVAIVGGVAVGVIWSAHRYALTSPRFAVRAIQLEGARRFGAEEVRAAGGIPAEANLFALDTAAVEQRLLENPWIAKAAVVRRLPSTLHVTLEERESRAITVLSGQPYLVSAQGEPFKRLDVGEPADLPVITGLLPEQLARDRRRELERLGLGLEVLRQYERLGMSRVYVAQEVHLAEGGNVSLTVG
ncbi:MAG TPA: FtsQ-type POTRA domain-containing protein, partial [Polyangiaceae bacterium]